MATKTPPAAAPHALRMSSIEINLNLLEVPRPAAVRGNKYVLWGDNHSFMPALLAKIRRSPTASALFGRKASLVAGDGFKVDEQAQPALAKFLKKVARAGRHQTGDKLLKRTVKDYTKLRGFALQIVWATDGEHIAEIYHEPFQRVACSPENEEGDVEVYWLCKDWSNKAKHAPKEIPAYNPDRAKLRGPVPENSPPNAVGPLLEPVQLYYHAEEGAGSEYYPELEYEAGIPYIEMEGDLADFHGTNVATGFNVQSIVAIQKGPEDASDGEGGIITAKSQRDAMERKFEEKYQGPRAKRVMFMYGDGSAESADRMAKITQLSAGSPEMYTTYADLAQEAILSAGSCTSPMVAGLPSANGGALGGNSQEMYQAFKLYFNSSCLPDQDVLLEAFKELLGKVSEVSFEGEPLDTPWLDIIGSLPVEYTFSEQTMELILSDDELRAKIGYKPTKKAAADENKIQPSESQKALAGSVGGQTSIDAMLEKLAQKLTTRESCIARLKTFFGLSQAEAEEIVPLPGIETATAPVGAL
jgi:hypothetical protein